MRETSRPIPFPTTIYVHLEQKTNHQAGHLEICRAKKKKKIHVSSDSYTCSTHVYRAMASPSVEVVCAADAVTDAGGCCTGGYGDVVVVVVTEDV